MGADGAHGVLTNDAYALTSSSRQLRAQIA